MPTYEVRYIVITEAKDEDEAEAIANEIIQHRSYDAEIVEI